MIYELTGRIDSVNASEVEAKLMEAFAENGELELDAAKLEYISSAGLRVLLKLTKAQKHVSVINVSTEVYEILKVTGFTEILDVKKAFRFVSVKDLKVIGKGGHGHVYRLSDDMIIKVYHDNSSLDMIDNERRYAKNAFMQGIPSPIAFDVVETEEGYGVVLEMAGAQTLSAFLMNNPDKVDEYAVKFAMLLKKLNDTPADPAMYGSIKDIYRERIDNTLDYFSEEEHQMLVTMLESIPDGSGMIHGDYHPNNVMVDANGELMLIDMADISRGNPLFDIGGAYTTMVQSGRRNPDLVPQVIGVDYEKSKRMFQIMVSQYYGTEDPAEIGMIMKRLALFGLFRAVTTIGMASANHGKFKDALVQVARTELFPNMDGIVQLFQYK